MRRSQKRVERKEGTAGKGSGGGPSIEMMDKNSDGKLSRDEVPERMAQRFERVDINGDGFIDAAEFETLMSQCGQIRDRGSPGEGSGR